MSGEKHNSKVIYLNERKRYMKLKNFYRKIVDFFLPDKPDKKGPDDHKKNKLKKPVNH